MEHVFRPRGVCSQLMRVEVENGIIKEVEVKGGCNGNLKGISSLIVGMDAREAISRMEGIRCGFKPTSCPDQLAKALRECLEKDSN
ncbi:MAG TPA: TIGR03905 family TSCPD domain-containing protein [Candidatus Scatomorpha merdavium]|nr:TIGR03905 family TSCPD domain-containing protein [Candidatus Scatomorpha merdavium]